MTNPLNPSTPQSPHQGGFQPPAAQPPQGFGAPEVPKKRGNMWTSRPAIGIAALVAGVALGAGGAAGGERQAQPAGITPTVTVTATAKASQGPTDEPSAQPTEEPTASETASPAPAKKSYKTLSSRQFKLMVKDPDSYIGKMYRIFGEITQFDAATGTDTFRADTGPKKRRISYGFVDYPENSFLSGAASKLKKLVSGDCFEAKVTVLGSFSYDTQAGGNTTVPLFQVDSISVYGSTD